MRADERVRVIAGENGNGLLQDDDAVVELLVDKVHGASGDLDAVVEGLLLRVEPGKGGQQRGVDVQDAVGEGLDELRREQAHVSGEADEVDVVLAQAGDDFRIVLGALAAAGFDGDGVEAALAGGVEAGRIGYIGDDDGDLAAGSLPCAMLSAMARKLEPRPERRMPRRLFGPDIRHRSLCGRL